MTTLQAEWVFSVRLTFLLLKWKLPKLSFIAHIAGSFLAKLFYDCVKTVTTIK